MTPTRKGKMGDSTDGSSAAAPSALALGQSHSRGGFLNRIFGSRTGNAPEANGYHGERGAAPSQAHGMINLRRMRVEDVAIPKADIEAVGSSTTKSELVDVFRKTGLTRLPVYDGTLDNPLGFAHLKDFALGYGFNGASSAQFNLTKMLRPLLFVPPSMPIGVLLTKMQTERRHMALVIDEYGGVDGLVTIEDLIEQVVGEIVDEHDQGEDQLWVEEQPGCYLAMAKMPLDEFEDVIGMKLTEPDEVDAEEIETLGGLVFMLSGRVPTRGEMVPHPEGLEFEVVDADPRRIKRLRVRMPGTGES